MLKLSHLVDDRSRAFNRGRIVDYDQRIGGRRNSAVSGSARWKVGRRGLWLGAHPEEPLNASRDDVTGRAKIYEAIRQGRTHRSPRGATSVQRPHQRAAVVCLDVETDKTKIQTDRRDSSTRFGRYKTDETPFHERSAANERLPTRLGSAWRRPAKIIPGRTARDQAGDDVTTGRSSRTRRHVLREDRRASTKGNACAENTCA